MKLHIKPVTFLLGTSTIIVGVFGAGLLIPSLGIAVGTRVIATTLATATIVSTID